MNIRQWQKWRRVLPLALTVALGLALGRGGRAAQAVPQGGYAFSG